MLALEVNIDETLEIRVGKTGTFVNELSEWPVRCLEEALSLIDRGSSNRHVASNNVNEHSSRSHLVLIIKVSRMNVRTGQHSLGVMNLVDLAGSERIKLTSATGARLKEAQNINKYIALFNFLNHLGH